MGLFDNMKKRKELQRLRDAADNRPSPETLMALATKLHENGEVEEALAALARTTASPRAASTSSR